jgi:hypothetical protein
VNKPKNDCFGTRKIADDGSVGPYVFETYAEVRLLPLIASLCSHTHTLSLSLSLCVCVCSPCLSTRLYRSLSLYLSLSLSLSLCSPPMLAKTLKIDALPLRPSCAFNFHRLRVMSIGWPRRCTRSWG